MPTQNGSKHPLTVALGNWLLWGEPSTHLYFMNADGQSRDWLVKSSEIVHCIRDFLNAEDAQKEPEFKKLYELSSALYEEIPVVLEIDGSDVIQTQLMTLIMSVYDDVTALDGVKDRLGTLWLHTASELLENDLDEDTAFGVMKTSNKLATLVKTIKLSEGQPS